jgi:hypothetical protein
MSNFMVLFCLLLPQEGDASGQSQKRVEGARREEPLEQVDLPSLLKKVEQLEAELKELRKPATPPDPKPKTPDPRLPGPTSLSEDQAAPSSQDSEEEKKRKQLEEEFKKALGQDKPAPPPTSAPQGTGGIPLGGGASLKLIDIAFDLLMAGGTSTATSQEIPLLQAGGHDPKNRGFTLQNAELTFSGVVDPYFRGDANIVLQIDDAGATTIELEEAYLTTLDLPYNLQVKAGQFFNAFGRINSTHPHTWDFVDQPVIVGRALGTDGYRAPGVQVSWLTPLPFFAELIGSIQNAQGDTAPYFIGTEGSTVAGRTLVNRPIRNLGDMVYLIRLKTSFDPSDEVTIVPGLSALFGPNASAQDTSTQVYGADFYLKWKPLANDQGWPFVAWQTEAMVQQYDAAEVIQTGVEVDRQKYLWDWGIYSQVVWGFMRPWTLGFRFDYANGLDDTFSNGSYSSLADSLRDQRARASISLTYYPSEFSKLRVQYNYDRSEFLVHEFNNPRDASSVWLQFEILFGAHGAHKF